MNDYQSLRHSKWECKYHVVFIPKYPARWCMTTAPPSGRGVPGVSPAARECDRGGHLQSDHVHMLLSIPPKYAVAQVVGISKGRVRFTCPDVWGRERNFVGEHFWAGGIGSRRSGE